jgi:uncharacterized protein YycO
MKDPNIYILASKGISLTSLPIRIYQFGFPYTHIAYVLNYGEPGYDVNNPKVIEAWWPKVRVGYFKDVHTPGTEFTVFKLKATEEQKKKVEKFLMSQVGKWYDLIGLMTFVLRWKKVAKNNFWFCSELVFAALKNAGIEILKFTEPQEVTPRLFLKSPLLEKVYDGVVPGEPRSRFISVSFSVPFR